MVNHNFEDNRGNRTRKVKGSSNLDPEKIIKDYLDLEGDKALGEILSHVIKSGWRYSKQGLIKKLKSMKKKKIIRIIKEKGSHTKYRTIDKTEFKIKSDAYSFKYNIGTFSLGSPATSKELNKIKKYKNAQQDVISKLIFNYGIISLYTLLASYRRSISPQHDNKKNKTMHELWLKNALAFEINLSEAKFSTSLKKELIQNIKNTNPKSKFTYPEIIDEAKKLESVFSKMFPLWVGQYQNGEKLIDKSDMNKFMRDAMYERPEYLLS